MAMSRRANRIRGHKNGLRPGLSWADAVRLLGVVTPLLGLAGVVTAGAAQASQPAKISSSTWKIESTPNPGSAEINVLSAVSCTSGTACTAVGSYASSLSSPGFALAERWNGKAWHIQPTPKVKGATGPELYGVSCPSASACTAVGTAFDTALSGDVNLAEAWNGKNWRVQAIPNPKAGTNPGLFAVSCTSARDCTAVGFYDNATGLPTAMVERWNGKAWRLQAIPRAAERTWLTGVSCPAARACTAVGYKYSPGANTLPLAEAWNGAKWRVQTVPLPRKVTTGILSGVSCTSPSACTATGTHFGTSPTLAERWNGKNWRVQPTPNPKNYGKSFGAVSLNSVSCTSANACTASGEYSPGGLAAYFIEAWNGKSWRLVTAPVPAHFVSGTLLGMSCARARCTAVGAWSGGVRSQETLAMAN
jgi:hypothetical protein